MPLLPSHDHSVTKTDAQRFIKNFRANQSIGNIKGGFFGKDALLKILDQPGCVGIRYYYAKRDNGDPVLVLVGENATGASLSDGVLAENPPLCPPNCPSADALDANV